jgi:phosphomannomutase
VTSSQAINPDAVRAYDLRGVVGRDLGLEDARALGLAYATVARRSGARRIAVGRDGRTSSPGLERALIAGLVEGGMTVFRCGLGPTPQLYFAVNEGLDGGIMVTGSHNPAGENGFKIVLGSEPVYGAALQALVAGERTAAPGGRVENLAVAEAYVQRLSLLAPAIKPFKVVWDCGHGAVSAVIGPLIRHLPGEHVLLNATVDGTFPAHHPDPSVAANLRQLKRAVVASDADIGVAFDGDGDRIGIVDGKGAILWPDQLLLLLAEEVLRSNPGATVVGDVKSSRVLFDGVRRLGGRPVMAPSGYVLIRAAMLREKALLAGEMSGHVVVGDSWCRVDDAIYVALRTLAVLSRRQDTLADFRENLPRTVSTPEIRLFCHSSRKQQVIDEVSARLPNAGARVDRTDGLRVTTDAGWWLLRASGTESKLVVRCEASDAKGLRELCRELAEHLQRNDVDASALAEGLFATALAAR